MTAPGRPASAASTGKHTSQTRPAVASTIRSPAIPASLSMSTNSRGARSRHFLDRVDAVAVERKMILDFRHGRIGLFIGPYRVGRLITPDRDAVVGAIALIGAVRR